MATTQKQLVCILVHGTWAPRASWTKKGSLLRRALEERFGDELVIKRFQWSGRNSHGARVRAGRRLAALIKQTVAQYPGSRIGLVAHSHGGNICIYALQETKEFQGPISAVMCMSTPFLVLKTRDTSTLGTGLFHLTAAAPIAVTALYWIVTTSPHWLAILGVALITWALGKFLGIAWLSICNILEPNVRYPSSDKLVIMRMTGDEASAAISTTSLVDWFVFQVWNLLRLLPGALIASAFDLNSTVLLNSKFEESRKLVHKLYYGVGVANMIFLDLSAMLLCAPAFVVMIFAIIMSWLSGAGILSVAAGLYSFCAEATPPGVFVVHHYPPATKIPFDHVEPKDSKSKIQAVREAHRRWVSGPWLHAPLLAHSALYDHPEAIEHILEVLSTSDRENELPNITSLNQDA